MYGGSGTPLSLVQVIPAVPPSNRLARAETEIGRLVTSLATENRRGVHGDKSRTSHVDVKHLSCHFTMSENLASSSKGTAPLAASPSLESTPASLATPDPTTSDKDLRAFEKWRKSAAWLTGIGLNQDDQLERERTRNLKRDEAMWIRCEKWKDDLLQTSSSLPSHRSCAHSHPPSQAPR